MKIKVEFNLHDLAIKSFLDDSGKAEREYEHAMKRHEEIYRKLFYEVMRGELDGFYYETGDGENGRKVIYHKSTKRPDTMQVSFFWIHNGEEIPTYDLQISPDNINKLFLEAAPDGVTIETIDNSKAA